MKAKKMTAIITVLAMVFSLLSGIYAGSERVLAAAQSVLPTVPGLYVTGDYAVEDGKVVTDTDAAGNIIPLDWDGSQGRWQDMDYPDYLTDGIEDGWGHGFDNHDRKWFDYIADGKVTHVNPSDLVVTHLDGTPCDHITITADPEDGRLALFEVKELENVLITYKGAEVNNKMVGVFALRSGFYTSETASLESQIHDDITIPEGETRDIYFHMTDTGDDDGFLFDPAAAVTVCYWDDNQGGDVEITGEAGLEYVELSPVLVEDPSHLIYKVTLNGKNTREGGYDLKLNYKQYNSDDSWEDEREVHVRIVEKDSLFMAIPEDITVKDGKYAFPPNVSFEKAFWFGTGSSLTPAYTMFKYSDEKGNLTTLSDPSKLTFYRSVYDEEKDMEVYTKVGSDVIKAEKLYADSDIMKLTYLGKEKDFDVSFRVTYEGQEPEDTGNALTVSYGTSLFDEVGTWSDEKLCDETYAAEMETDGTSDINIYAAHVNTDDLTPWNKIQSVEIKSLELVDDKNTDLSSKVTRDKNVSLTFEDTGRAMTYAEKITVLKGTLTGAARLRMTFHIRSLGGDGNIHEYDVVKNVFFFYSSDPVNPDPSGPVKGDKVTVNGNTYTITEVGAQNTVTLTKGKAGAKSASVPAAITVQGISFKVTQIGSGAFKGNKKMTKTVIGKNVKAIGSNAYNGCKKLKDIRIQGTALTKIGSKAFSGVPKKAKTKVPKAKKNAYKKLLKKGGYKGKVK